MKFTNGQWLLRPGVEAHYAVEAYEAAKDEDSLVVLATTTEIKHRGDTLQGPALTVTVDSPLADVLRVKAEHFVGGNTKRAMIPLQISGHVPVEVEVAADHSKSVITSGALSAEVTRDYKVVFRGDGKVLTKSESRGLGFMQTATQGNFMHEQLSLAVGENVYGLGERFTAFVKNGQVVENTNKDGGTACEQAYKCVPFYLTNRGYGVLVNEAGPVSFEIASEKVSRVQFSKPGESLEYFLIYGPTPKDILRKLTALTGRPALPPAWTFGLWLSTSFTTNYDEKTTSSFIDEMKRRDLPLSVFHFDCFWMREFQWCDFEWDARMFPDPVGMLRRLHDRGLKICVWINSYVAQRSRLFAEGAKQGYFLKRKDGSVWQTDLWQPGMAIVDFTNPAAKDWFRAQLGRLMDMGVDCFKTDFGERIPEEDVEYFDGSDPVEMHNLYPILYNEAVFSLVEERKGKGQGVVFARAAYASGQRFPVHWGGDCWSTFESMAESLRGGLSLTTCGFGFWSHDIGGFEGNPPPAVYKRWLQFGLLSSHSRLHGSSSVRVPWSVDEESCDVLRKFTKLKCRLMPYLFEAAIRAHTEGTPVMRAMMLEFANDPACDALDRQYMLGSSLLVAPVFNEEGRADFYLPDGTWTHLLTGEVKQGGRWYSDVYDFLNLPLFVRGGTVLALGAHEDQPDYDFVEGVTLQAFELADKQTVEVQLPSLEGSLVAKATVTRAGGKYRAKIEGRVPKAWSLQVGATTVQAQGATAELEA